MPTRRQLKRAAKKVAQRASSTQAALASADSDDEPVTTLVVIELTTAAPLDDDGINSKIQSHAPAPEATESLDAPLNSDTDSSDAPATEATEPLDAPLNSDTDNSDEPATEATEPTEPLDAPLNSDNSDNSDAPATEATEPLDTPQDNSNSYNSNTDAPATEAIELVETPQDNNDGNSSDAPALECVNDAQAFVTITNSSVGDKMVEVPANDDGATLERSSGSNAEPQDTKSRGPFKSAMRKVAIAVVVPVAVGGLVICASSMVCAQGGWALTKVGARAHLGALRLAFRGAGAVVGITTGVASCVFSSRTK
jgi:hypothetical protein